MERLDMTKIQIAVAYHKDSKLIKNDCLLPIQAGKACSDIELDMQGDDTGDNISSKNFGYAELTVIYWLWKNSKADIKGLFHYRRFLDLNLKSEHYNEDIYEYLLSEHFSSPNFLEKMEISQNNINELLKKYTILTRRKEDLHSWSNYSVREHYAAEHHGEHFEKALEIIKQDYPDYYPSAKKLADGHTSYFTNVFIMKSNEFDKYCSWMFDILFKIETTLNLYDKTLAPNTKKARWAGFLGERLTAIYIQKQIDDGKKIGEFPAVILTPNKNQKWYECNTYDTNLYAEQQTKNITINNTENSKQPIISVCIAAYNVEKYIEKCLLSVINQTLQNIEIIVVNDGSKDNTLDIIKKFAKQEKRIIVIDQENRGLGNARNCAIKISKGKYIHLMDADDYMDACFLEKMVSNAEKHQSDMVISNHIVFEDGTNKELYRSTLPHTLIGGRKNYGNTPDLLMVPCHVWDKIYKRDLIKDTKFPDRSNGEDIPFWYATILSAKSVSILREPLYHYRMNMHSVQTKPENVINCFNNLKYVEQIISRQSYIVQQYFEIFKQILIAHMIYRARYALLRNNKFSHEFYIHVKQFLGENYVHLSAEMQLKKAWYDCDFSLIKKLEDCSSDKEFRKLISAFGDNKSIHLKVKLFGFLPIFSIKQKRGKTVYKLCGIPVYKIRRMANNITTKYYFCGIPLLKISKK